MYLFFDTETTGLPQRYNAPLSAVKNWPRMIQLAWILTNKEGEIIRQQMHIVKPTDFKIPKQASDIHRITTERAVQEGVLIQEVLADFSTDLAQASSMVAHNISFDEKILGCEYYRQGVKNPFAKKQMLCTMKSSTDYVKTGYNSYYGTYKWPKLQELHQKVFGHEFEEAHDALVDVQATVRCFFELRKLAVL